MQSKGNIAIDGPAGAGKSTVAKLVAQELNYVYIDTGAMYRALTWKAIKEKIALDDEEALNRLAQDTEIAFEKKPGTKNQIVLCDGEDITLAIRSPEVSQAVSQVARVPAVREILVGQQRRLAETGNVVMDGRDIGSNVLPDAPFKFFLTASLETRARRRYKELISKGYQTSLKQLQREIAERDAMDSQRETAPLIKAHDAVQIDTGSFSPRQVADIIVQHVRERL